MAACVTRIVKKMLTIAKLKVRILTIYLFSEKALSVQWLSCCLT